MGRHSTTITLTTLTPPVSPSRKRKRENSPAAEIEVDVSAPEPPSKKALRKAKKTKNSSFPTPSESTPNTVTTTHESTIEGSAPTPESKRSDFGIWVGNLPWRATKLDIRNFLIKDTKIEDDMITRLHMPPPSRNTLANSRQKIKPQNQGFAYIDFSTEEALAEALTLSEKLITGRRVLIKDSKCFEGRPDKSKEEKKSSALPGKPPSQRIFVGNLGFDITKDVLKEHFARCGEVIDVHVATFEDTGKCKGYAWVEFAELVASEAAIRGWVDFEQKEDLTDEDDGISESLADQETPKKPKLRKWWVNRLSGRPLRMEFAEGKDVRYQKRYSKEGTARKQNALRDPDPEASERPVQEISSNSRTSEKKMTSKPLQKVDARTIKPGKALAAAPRLTGGIVESKGKKTTFV